MLKDVHRSVRSPVSTVKSRRMLSCLCLHAKRYTKKHPDMYAHTHMCTYRHAWTCIGNVRESEKRVSIVFFQSLLDIGR